MSDGHNALKIHMKPQVAEIVTGGVRECLELIMRKSGVNDITITSAFRDAHGQARAMYNNLEAKHPAQGGRPQRMVTDVYQALRTRGASEPDTLAAMEKKINEIGPEKVSKHSRSPLWLVVIDISKNKMPAGKHAAFVDAVRSQMFDRVHAFGHFLERQGAEFKDPVFHLEILTDYAYELRFILRPETLGG